MNALADAVKVVDGDDSLAKGKRYANIYSFDSILSLSRQDSIKATAGICGLWNPLLYLCT